MIEPMAEYFTTFFCTTTHRLQMPGPKKINAENDAKRTISINIKHICLLLCSSLAQN